MKQAQADPVVAMLLENLQTGLCLTILFENGPPVLRLLQEGKVCSNGVLSGFTADGNQHRKCSRHQVMGLEDPWFHLASKVGSGCGVRVGPVRLSFRFSCS